MTTNVHPSPSAITHCHTTWKLFLTFIAFAEHKLKPTIPIHIDYRVHDDVFGVFHIQRRRDYRSSA
jgi:hypothetical protein